MRRAPTSAFSPRPIYDADCRQVSIRNATATPSWWIPASAHGRRPSIAALNASRIDPLPHQFEAVYEHLLARPVVRALLAHDAGAGKTIMAGMVIKELKRRQGARRILIVTPAGLTEQWRRELLTKFGEDFTIIARDTMQSLRLDTLDVWRGLTWPSPQRPSPASV